MTVKRKNYQKALKLFGEIAEELSKELSYLAGEYRKGGELRLYEDYDALIERFKRKKENLDGIYRTAFASAVWFLEEERDRVVWEKDKGLFCLSERLKNPEKVFGEFLEDERASLKDQSSVLVRYCVPEIDDIIISEEDEMERKEGILCPDCGTFEDYESLSRTKNWTQEAVFHVHVDYQGEILDGSSEIDSSEHSCGFYTENYTVSDFYAKKVGENEYLLEGEYWQDNGFPEKVRIEERDGKRVMVDENGKVVHKFVREPVKTWTPKVLNGKEAAEYLLKTFGKYYTGTETGAVHYFDAIERDGGLFPNEEGEVGFAEAFFKAPLSLLRKVLKEKGIQAEFDVVDKLIDSETKYAVFDIKNGILLESGYIDELEPKQDTPEKLLYDLAKKYETYRELYEGKFDVDLPRINPEKVRGVALEVYREIENEFGGPEL